MLWGGIQPHIPRLILRSTLPRHTIAFRMSSSNSTPAPTPAKANEPPLVMQLVVDRTIALEWTKGPLMAQAAHAAMAVAARTAGSANTQVYLSPENIGSMHKVALRTSSKQSLTALAEKLTEQRKLWLERSSSADAPEEEEFPDHVLWIEQPENIPTVLAIAPNRRPALLKKVLNKCSLLTD